MWPARRFRMIPAWAWPLATATLFAVAVSLPPPDPPYVPDHAYALFRDPLLVAREGEGYRVVLWQGAEGAEGHGPVWSINLQTARRSTSDRIFAFGLDSGPGLFRLREHRAYQLTALRQDKASRLDPPGTCWMSPAEAAALRPLAVAELNLRSGGERVGAKLGGLLDRGEHRESWICYQNGIVVLAWLSFAATLLALASMFIPPRSPIVGTADAEGRSRTSPDARGSSEATRTW